MDSSVCLPHLSAASHNPTGTGSEHCCIMHTCMHQVMNTSKQVGLHLAHNISTLLTFECLMLYFLDIFKF